MSGDGLVWMILLLLILLSDGSAIYLHNKNKMPLWLSGIIMGICVPILGFIIGDIFLKIDRVVDPTGTHEGVAFATGFIVVILLGNAILFFIIGLIIKIISFLKSKRFNN